MADVRELGQRVKQKYPGVYDNIDDAELGRRVKAKYPGAYDQFTDTPAQEGPGFLGNIAIGGQRFLRKVGDAAQTGGEIVSSALSGDFRPLKETAEIAGRAAAPFVGALGGRPELAASNYLGQSVQQAAPIAAVEQARTTRRDAGPNSEYWRRSRADIARLDAEAGRDTSLLGKITRRTVSVGGEVATAMLSGGAAPLMAAGLELNSPENIPLALALGGIPGGAARAARSVTPAVEKTLGVEAAQQAGGGLIRLSGAAVDEAAIRAADSALNAAVLEAAEQVPRSLTRQVADNIAAAYHLPRAVMASADISAPFRQGAIFTISNPTMAARAGLQMFRAFRTKNFERIGAEIARDADAELGQKFGLHLGSQIKEGLKRGEEAFLSKLAGKIPIVKQSENAYIAYLDVMRVQKFKQYKQLIDNAALTPGQAERGYEAAARWVNYATGRGDFGATADKMMPLLNTFFFAPKYAMSRFNLLNPLYYAKNATTQEGRIILKEQAKELFKFAGVIGSTMYLAKLAGADVGLNPNKSDFLKIRAGQYVYDLGAGLTQTLRLVYRTSADLARIARGDKAERGESVGDVSFRFLRSKLGPVPSWFVDAVERKTYIGKPYSTGAAIRDRTIPIMWNDWIDAGMEDGFGGILKVTPGGFGVGVSRYEERKPKQGR